MLRNFRHFMVVVEKQLTHSLVDFYIIRIFSSPIFLCNMASFLLFISLLHVSDSAILTASYGRQETRQHRKTDQSLGNLNLTRTRLDNPWFCYLFLRCYCSYEVPLIGIFFEQNGLHF